MQTTEAAKAPSLFKAALLFAVTAAMVALSSRAPAQELPAASHAYAGAPSVRIRGADHRGLSAVAFADWLSAHDTARSPRSAALFVQADINHDGWVSPDELKKLLVDMAKADRAA